MAKQHPIRPWSRLASLRPALPPVPSLQAQSSGPSEPSAAAPLVTPATTRFTGAAGSRTSSPSSSLPNSPSLKASQAPNNTSTIENNNNAYANATKSPQRTTPAAIQTTMQPQNHKNITPPPSSSHLKVKTEVEPKIKVESEQKTLLVQKESGDGNKKQGTGNDEKHVTGKENETKEKGIIHKKVSDSEDSSGARAITLAGENRGAYMEIIQSSKKPNFLHKKGNSKIKVYDYESENFVSGEGNANGKKNNKSHKERILLYSPPIGAYINSNVQSVNNSLLYYTSCTSNDPGVQLTLSRKPSGESEGFQLKDHVKEKINKSGHRRGMVDSNSCAPHFVDRMKLKILPVLP